MSSSKNGAYHSLPYESHAAARHGDSFRGMKDQNMTVEKNDFNYLNTGESGFLKKTSRVAQDNLSQKCGVNHEQFSAGMSKLHGLTEQDLSINSAATSVTGQVEAVPEKRWFGKDEQAVRSQPVHDGYGQHVQNNSRKHENDFENFYNNFKPGYAYPEMDPDGHHLGDTRYLAPVPPERDKNRKGILQHLRMSGVNDQSSITYRLNAGKLSPRKEPSAFRLPDEMEMDSSLKSKLWLSDLQLEVDDGQNSDRVGSSSYSLDRRSSISGCSPKENAAGSRAYARAQSLIDLCDGGLTRNTVSRTYPQTTDVLKGRYIETSSSIRPNNILQKDSIISLEIHKDRPASDYAHSTNSNTIGSQHCRADSETKKAYIIKSTLCYNTSTQTDTTLDTPNMSGPLYGGFETQLVSQIIPLTLEVNGKIIEEKSIQTTPLRSFVSSFDLDGGKRLRETLELYSSRLPEFQTPSFGISRASRDRLSIDSENNRNKPSDNKLDGNNNDSGKQHLGAIGYGNKVETHLGRMTDLLRRREFSSVTNLADLKQHADTGTLDLTSRNINTDSENGAGSLNRLFTRPEILNHNLSNIGPSSERSFKYIHSTFSPSYRSTKGLLTFSPGPSGNSNYQSNTGGVSFSGSDLIHTRRSSLPNSLESTARSSVQVPSSVSNSSVPTFRWKKIIFPSPEEVENSRLGSDSVFLDDDKDSSVSEVQYLDQLSRRCVGSPKTVTGNVTPPNSSYTAIDSSHRALISPDKNSGPFIASSPRLRSKMSSESSSLTQIMEESDVTSSESSTSRTISAGSDTRSAVAVNAGGNKQIEKENYQWRNDSWLRGNIKIPGPNLKRASSEQTLVSDPVSNFRLSNQIADSGVYNKSNVSSVPSAFRTYDSSHNIFVFPDTFAEYPTSSGHNFYNSPDQSLENKTDRRSSTSSIIKSSHADVLLPDKPSLFDEARRSSSDTVSALISQVNENLTRSAQRVTSLSRSSSSSSRNSLDYLTTVRPERNRRETDWTRLRSLGSLRYSPDSDRLSNVSSFTSENLYEDLSILTSSTPRSSFAESKERDIMQDPAIHDASMDSGLVVSPTYQNFPSRRRSPPTPPEHLPLSEPAPPPLPPRRSARPLSEDKPGPAPGSAMFHGTPKQPPPPPSDKSRIHVIPLGKHLDEDGGVDNSKLNFKDLMTQWKNCSPGDSPQAPDFRRQHGKQSGAQIYQHQYQKQQAHAVPATYERDRIHADFASSYRLESVQRHETSASGTSPPFSLPLSASGNPSPLLSLSNSGFLTPTRSSVSNPSSVFGSSAFLNTNTSPSGHVGYQTTRDLASNNLYSYHATVNTNSGRSPDLHTFPATSPQSSSTERTSLSEYARSRSSSDLLTKQSQSADFSESTRTATKAADPNFRDRSSSYSDILSDNKHSSHLVYQHKQHVKGAALETSSTRSHPQDGHNASISNGEISMSGLVTAYDNQAASRFAADSYIGHKNNNSSRVIGTYKRSNSAAVLQANNYNNNNNSAIVGAQSAIFQDSPLGQQLWSSELVLSQAGGTAGRTPIVCAKDTTTNGAAGSSKEYFKGPTPSSTVPVRPPRPSTYGRRNNGHTSASSTGISQNGKLTSVSLSALDSVITSASIVLEQPGRVTLAQGNPLSSSSPSYSANQSVLRDHSQKSTADNLRSPNSGTWSNSPQSDYFLQRRLMPNDSFCSSTTSEASKIHHKSSSPSSSHNNNSFCDQHSPIDPPPTSHPPRDYQRRESAPVRSISSSSNTENMLSVPDEDYPPRRRSDSSVISKTLSNNSRPQLSTISHRQPSQEEIECDESARQLAEEVEGKERKLYEVLLQDTDKKRMLYMDGLFSEACSFNHKTRYSVKTSPRHGAYNMSDTSDKFKSHSLPRDYQPFSSQASLDKELVKDGYENQDVSRAEGTTVMKHKEELLEKLYKKLEVLKSEKLLLQQEIADNILLGNQVCQVAESKCQTPSEKEKFKTHIDDLEKIVRLLLNLSGQLARAENSLQALGAEADAKIKKQTLDKRDRLHAKHEEAKLLKEAVDKRSDQWLLTMQERLSEQELSDYKHFINMKSKLTIQMQEIDDKIALGEQQILALRTSLPGTKTCLPGLETRS